MTLRKLTLSVSLLATSLMLATPAQAETWACAHMAWDKPVATLFTREGNTFQSENIKFKILHEDKILIQIWFNGGPRTSGLTLPRFCLLYKKTKSRSAHFGCYPDYFAPPVVGHSHKDSRCTIQR